MAARFTDEAGAGHAGKQPLSTPSGARGRGRPRAQSAAGQMREAGAGLRGTPGRMHLAGLVFACWMCEQDTRARRPEMRIGGPGLAA